MSKNNFEKQYLPLKQQKSQLYSNQNIKLLKYQHTYFTLVCHKLSPVGNSKLPLVSVLAKQNIRLHGQTLFSNRSFINHLFSILS